jgi:hypothetical protein
MKSRGMTDFGEHSPRRYFVDSDGRRVLIGLTLEETLEFETLDSLAAPDDGGNHRAPSENGIPVRAREERWLELYGKHDTAWKQWMAKARPDRRASSGFVNQDRVI